MERMKIRNPKIKKWRGLLILALMGAIIAVAMEIYLSDHALTPDQISRVDQFVEDHGKDSTGDIIKKVDDLTKDIISSGEKEWNEMSSAEQDAVNQRLKDGGCPYTYSQLLELAKPLMKTAYGQYLVEIAEGL